MEESPEDPPQPEVFASTSQVTGGLAVGNVSPLLVIRTATDPLSYVGTLRGLVRQRAPTLALDSVMTMDDRVMTSLAKPRLYATVLGSFGVCALLITGVGLFGVISFNVSQRTREIGVRCALGAAVHDIVGFIVRQTLWIVAIGLAIGFAMALSGTRILSSFLYGISRYDPLTFAEVGVAILLVAIVACLLPARRAAKISPLTAIRAR
jgi:ABC-type antimicrobial peptide transport system permease subunit